MTVLLDAAVAATVLLSAAWCAALLLHRSPADLRRAVWRAAIAGVVLLPLAYAAPLPRGAAVTLVSDAVPAAQAFGVSDGAVLGWWRICWAAGALLVLTRLAIGLWQVRRWSRTAVEVDGVRYSPAVAVPLTWGLWRPEIILPASARDWTKANRDLAVCHEAAHVTHHDWAWQTAARLLAAVLWFHPLVWIADRALRREAERVADDAVLAAGVRSADYAGWLVHSARAIRYPAAVGMAQSDGLEARVRRLLDGGLRRGPARRSAVFAVSCLFMVLMVAVAVAQRGPVYEVDDPGVTPPSVVREVRPQYPPEALQDKVEGQVVLSLIVDPDGRPQDIKVIRPLEVSLDRASVEAASQWRFLPGRRDDRAVHVRVDLELAFRLR